MKVWVWKQWGDYCVSPVAPKPQITTYSGARMAGYFTSRDYIAICSKWGKLLFSSLKKRDGVRTFNITVKEAK
mgnify:CR=1 FL=1